VGRVVADQRQRLGVAVGEDRDRGPVGQRRRQIAQLAVDADRQGGLGESGTDRSRSVGATGAVGQLKRLSVRKFRGDVGRRLDERMLLTEAKPPTAR
jgi:hypothetical protein